MSDFLMPSLGADMTAGTLSEWLVKPGDRVKRGDVVAVVDTDKAAIEIEVFESGVVDEILVTQGTHVPVGTPLAKIGAAEGADPSEPGASPLEVPLTTPHASPERPAAPEAAPPQSPEDPRPSPAPPPPASPQSHAGSGTTTPATSGSQDGYFVFASPLARKTAREAGIDLASLRGTGPQGAITREDVERAVASRFGSAGPMTIGAAATLDQKHLAMRRATGALMARSKREIPHYYLTTTIDMTRAQTWLQTHNAGAPITHRLISAALLLKAVTLAVLEVPEMNGHYVGEEYRPSGTVHLGVAVSLRGGGLIAPAVRDAQSLELREMMEALRGLVDRARKGRLHSSEMSDPTITVTNLGDQGVDAVYGVIYPPQVALVGFGKIVQRPWAAEGMVGAHQVVTATLSADHRVSDGHRGAAFLSAIDRLLQKPEEL